MNDQQMSDRELLELAARAAGIDLWPGDAWRDSFARGLLLGNGRNLWNPLEDDGDALRLAVAIPGLDLQWIAAEAWQAYESQTDRLRYVRRAIVRATAEITTLKSTASLSGGAEIDETAQGDAVVAGDDENAKLGVL